MPSVKSLAYFECCNKVCMSMITFLEEEVVLLRKTNENRFLLRSKMKTENNTEY